jgi:hypothetical protein
MEAVAITIGKNGHRWYSIGVGRLLLSTICLVLAAGCQLSRPGAHSVTPDHAPYAVVKELDSATRTVFVQTDSFTSVPIAAALVSCQKRGVRVVVIFDKSQKAENYASAEFLACARIEVLIDSEHSMADKPAIIIDGRTVITGAANFTMHVDDKTPPPINVLHGSSDVGEFERNWHDHERHSKAYEAATRVSDAPSS